MNIPSNNLTQDLLNALEEDSTAEIKTDNDVLSFLITYNISPGKEKVLSKALYNLYKAWSKAPLTRCKFSEVICNILPTQNVFKLINKSAIEIVGSLLEIRGSRRKYQHGNIKAKRLVDEFFATYKLSKGRTWIPAMILYERLRTWVFDVKKEKTCMGYERFTQICKIFLKYKRVRKTESTWFSMTNCDIINITRPIIREYIKKAKEHHKDYNRMYMRQYRSRPRMESEKKEQKIEHEVSSTLPTIQSDS